MAGEKQDRGILRIDVDECKGCGLCIEACPPKVIGMNERLNHFGYKTAFYAGAGCTGCGICFLVCPEPGAITVYRALRQEDSQGAVGAAGPSHSGTGETTKAAAKGAA
jgi:2-oxoglutarate ferredoxin oxidoreductase subunit delta